ncbi:hypothetical protein [Streptomyces sp. NPDC003032]
MRFRSSVTFGVATTVAAALTSATAGTSAAVAQPGLAAAQPGLAAASPQVRQQRSADVDPPTCATADSAAFPIDTRIQEGPAAYRPGGDRQGWTIDLTNATGEPCAGIHPILVLVDQRQPMRSDQIRLEFHDGTRWRPVRFERTDQDEHVGVFDDGFPGFTVGPGSTVTVKVRLGFTDGTRPTRVVASAALVQRRDDDGDWVGDSNDYTFAIADDAPDDPSGTAPPPRPEPAEQLAQTGPAVLLGLGAAAGALVLGGAAALLARYRRLRAGGR